jgi:hypothetical protein
VKEKHDGINPKELFLYHGTSKTDPSFVYNCEEGFDLRFSNAGMWGTAVYFAANSNYSDTYAFDMGNGGDF